MKRSILFLCGALLGLVVVVNIAFLFVATQNSDGVVESYSTVER